MTRMRFAIHFVVGRLSCRRRGARRGGVSKTDALQAGLILAVTTAATAIAEPATYATRVAPILEKHCSVCHGAEKQKAELRLDSHAAILVGAKSGPVLKPGDAKDSELLRRISLPASDEDVMPSEGKPHLAPQEIAVLEKWIAAGAPATAEFDAPAPVVAVILPPAAPDYRARLAEATELANSLGVRLVPRSRVTTDGLILRTASAPTRCDDAILAKLTPVADLIVEAELGRTKVSDAGLAAVSTFTNLLRLDLAHTAVTSAGVAKLTSLTKLESLNLSETKVDGVGLAVVRALPALKKGWVFGTAAEPAAP